jgi:hypothetical protein
MDVSRVYDSCSDKDCLEDLPVIFTDKAQPCIDRAVSVKVREVTVSKVFLEVEPVAFNRGFYSVDMTFFFDICLSVFTLGCAQPVTVHGLSVFCKKVILYGSEGSTTTFSSLGSSPICGRRDGNLPVAEVEVVEPIILGCKVINPSCNCCCTECENIHLPDSVLSLFPDGITDIATKKLVVSLGLFSVVRIVRDVQVKIPAAKFCLPEKECTTPREEEPCSFFEKLNFPTNEFFPPENSGNNCGF